MVPVGVEIDQRVAADIGAANRDDVADLGVGCFGSAGHREDAEQGERESPPAS